MKSLTTLTSLATNLTNNTSAANSALMAQLIGDRHRLLIQKFFANERTATTSTVGGQSLTLTGSLALNAVSGTLTASWTQPTVRQLVNFSNSNQRDVLFTNGSTAITWTVGLTSTATTAIATVGVQAYQLPANISKIKDFTINVGQLKYLPVEINTRREWDMVNFLPYTSDIPEYFFVYNGNVNIFPIPSTTGNVITYNYKTRVADLSFADYSVGNIGAAGMVAGSTAVTGTSTLWNTGTNGYPINTPIDYYNLKIKANPPYGDGIWYDIYQFNSDTSLTLVEPVVNAPNITAATTYTIGQFPLIEEDFQDMLVYGALAQYYTNIVPDPNKFKQNNEEYQMRYSMMEDYAGTRTALSVDLGQAPNLVNPNLFYLGT